MDERVDGDEIGIETRDPAPESARAAKRAKAAADKVDYDEERQAWV